MSDSNKLTVAISSRALFDLEESHRVFETEGVDAYCRYQIEREEECLAPGVAFGLVQKLLRLNRGLAAGDQVEVVLISRNNADTGLRVFNSIQHYELNISRAAFTGGQSPYRYVRPFNAQLFLSSDPQDVRNALESGFAAATILPSRSQPGPVDEQQVRIAFDGDAVLFSDDAERVYQDHGLEAFTAAEIAAANDPLPGGPFKDDFRNFAHLVGPEGAPIESNSAYLLCWIRG